MKTKTYEEAESESFKVKWKMAECTQGSACWCRIITTETPIIYDTDEEFYIVGSGSIPKKFAEYLVNIHNQNLDF